MTDAVTLNGPLECLRDMLLADELVKTLGPVPPASHSAPRTHSLARSSPTVPALSIRFLAQMLSRSLRRKQLRNSASECR